MKSSKLFNRLKSSKPLLIVGKALSHTVANNVTERHLSESAVAKLTRLLKMKFWFGGEVIYPFIHPFNKVQDALMIYLDGCCQYKFKVHKNGRLRLMRIYSKHSMDFGLKPLQTITADELYVLIARGNNDYAGSFMQLTSPTPIPINMAELREVETLRRQCKGYIFPLKPTIKFL